MFKRIILCLLMSCVSCLCYASLTEADDAADGWLTAGEYDGSAFDLEGYEELIVAGGGAYSIDGRDNSYIKVEYTSVSSDPLHPVTNSKGIWDIFLYDNSKLLWLDGAADEITVRDDAQAILKGGYVDAITIYHFSGWSSEVTIYCQPGYTKNDNGISGLWADGTPFDINFIDVGGVFTPYPTADYVSIVEVPEPVTLALFGFGSLLIRRKK